MKRHSKTNHQDHDHDQDHDQDHDHDQDQETKLINQGTYGCIYYPSLPFQQYRNKKHPQVTRDNYRTKYISKLQKHNFHSDFEDYIGRKIQEIPSYELFFVPVLKTSKIDLATIKQSYIIECDAVRKYMKPINSSKLNSKTKPTPVITSDEYKKLNKKFIIQRMKYINGIHLHDYILDTIENNNNNNNNNYENDQPYHLMSILFDLYERINDSIQILIKYKLVHYDLKENNIVVEITQQLPYIIDFGLSIDVARLLENPWNEKEEKNNEDSNDDKHTSSRNEVIDSNLVYNSTSSKIFKHNYLWRQHFYVHAPDYNLWPMEIHIITYLINEDDTLTAEDLERICHEYISKKKVLAYMSPKFKEQLFHQTVATYSRFIYQPREKVLNELIKYWDKWDIYAINIMFLKILYKLIFDVYTDSTETTETTETTEDAEDDTDDDEQHKSHQELRQKKIDPHVSEKDIEFHTKYKMKLKYNSDNRKIMNALQVMLQNIHPNPDKRMTPQETKILFESIFYEC